MNGHACLALARRASTFFSELEMHFRLISQCKVKETFHRTSQSLFSGDSRGRCVVKISMVLTLDLMPRTATEPLQPIHSVPNVVEAKRQGRGTLKDVASGALSSSVIFFVHGVPKCFCFGCLLCCRFLHGNGYVMGFGAFPPMMTGAPIELLEETVAIGLVRCLVTQTEEVAHQSAKVRQHLDRVNSAEHCFRVSAEALLGLKAKSGGQAYLASHLIAKKKRKPILCV